jgi:hypothetical protein
MSTGTPDAMARLRSFFTFHLLPTGTRGGVIDSGSQASPLSARSRPRPR